MSVNWRDLSYLSCGNERQRHIFRLLNDSRILDLLKSFDPVVVSTICVDLDIEDSDVDVICQVSDRECFIRCLNDSFSRFSAFSLRNVKDDICVCTFFIEDIEFEIYGSELPVEKQNAYRHLSVMKRLVELGGQPVRNAIKEFKRSGLKTEPAIARLLRLEGDPFQAVLDLEDLTDTELRELIAP